MVQHHVIWHGTRADQRRLENAINRHCDCEYNIAGVRIVTCGAHKMLLDQATLNHFDFVARNRGKYSQAEHDLRAEFGLT